MRLVAAVQCSDDIYSALAGNTRLLGSIDIMYVVCISVARLNYKAFNNIVLQSRYSNNDVSRCVLRSENGCLSFLIDFA